MLSAIRTHCQVIANWRTNNDGNIVRDIETTPPCHHEYARMISEILNLCYCPTQKSVLADIFSKDSLHKMWGAVREEHLPLFIICGHIMRALNIHKDWGLTLFTGQSQVTQ